MKRCKKIICFVLAAVSIIICSSCSGEKEDVSSVKNSSVLSSSKKVETSSVSLPEEESSQITSSENSSKVAQTVVSAVQGSSDYSVDYSVPQDISALDNTCYGWGPGYAKNNIRPSSAVSYNQKYQKYDALFVGEDNKNVYMTFDEGYENGYTAPILDTLKQKGVKAVFFVTYDYVKRNPELVKRMINEGHTLGNHSWSHPSLPKVSDEKAAQEILKLHNYVKENFSYEMKYFRFPMGEHSERTLALCKKLNYKSVFWSFAYRDWETNNQPDEKAALERITGCAHNGAIYLLHAVSKTNSNVLGAVIEDLRGKGYVWSEFNL